MDVLIAIAVLLIGCSPFLLLFLRQDARMRRARARYESILDKIVEVKLEIGDPTSCSCRSEGEDGMTLVAMGDDAVKFYMGLLESRGVPYSQVGNHYRRHHGSSEAEPAFA